MSIGFDKTTSEGSTSKFIRVSPETAIDGGRYIKELETGVLESGAAWLQCTVRDENGSTANKRWFEPTMGGYIDDDKKLKNAQNKIIKIVANLVRRFKGAEYVIAGAPTFKEFFDRAVKAVTETPNWDKKELRVFVVNGKPTDDGAKFPTLPNFAPIFEDISVNPTKMKIGEYHDVEAWSGDSAAPDDDGAAPDESTETVSF